ncbi:MAG: magnesium and cobalt transport protein CorA [Lentisphaerae bacterium]|nr:MAG: magnesium and cobalt transport protein CorA [Lentisphaerota bacterium]
MPPGSAVLVGESAEPTRISVIDFDEKHVDTRPLCSIEETLLFRDTATVTWINITGLHDVEVIEAIGQAYGIHPLVIEDILHLGQRPKIEFFDGYIFTVIKMIRVEEETGALDVEQVSLILGPSFVMTFQEKEGDVLDPLRKRIHEGKGRIRKSGADYLFYAIIDIIVDNYFVVLDHLAENLDELEEQVISSVDLSVLNTLHKIRRELIRLRKNIGPMREELAVLYREEDILITDNTLPYFHDLHDHIIRIIENLDTMRELVSGLRELYLSGVSTRTNEIMKVLTLVGTLFIPLTFIVGVYGMNFTYMPELKWRWGYPLVWFIMLLIAAGMIRYFRKKNWI